MTETYCPRDCTRSDWDEEIDAIKASLAIATEENARLRDELEAEKVRRETAEAEVSRLTNALQRRAHV